MNTIPSQVRELRSYRIWIFSSLWKVDHANTNAVSATATNVEVMLFDPQNPAAMAGDSRIGKHTVHSWHFICLEVGSAQIELDIMPCEYGAFWVQPFQALPPPLCKLNPSSGVTRG